MLRFLLVTGFVLLAYVPAWAQDDFSAELASNQYDLNHGGHGFLEYEARMASFFLLGELHGEKEIPELIRALWPEMRKIGYAHVAAEVSPWAARELQSGPVNAPFGLSLWTREEALFIRGSGADIWGCDIEEGQPEKLAGDIDRESIRDTRRVEALRAGPNTRYEASCERENVMKKLLARQLANHPGEKVLLRFGRNHLHRGYDGRGVSTLGNFAVELAVSKGLRVFNVAAFAAGGTEQLNGKTFDADERGDEPAFQLLAGLAKYPATVFDLRPIRAALHGIRADRRSALQTNLIYWADSYDAIVCYQTVTPR